MKEITIRAMAIAAAYSILLFGAASLLASCSVGKYAFHCTVTQPDNCN